MSTEQRTETPNFQAESFMTRNVMVAPATVKGVAAGVSPATLDSSSGSAVPSAPIEDEETLWEGRYSPKNFVGRAICCGVFSVAWVALALATWGFGYTGLAWPTYAAGAAIVVYWFHPCFQVLSCTPQSLLPPHDRAGSS